MKDIFAHITWHETTPLLTHLITAGDEIAFRPLTPGLEADVVKITQGDKHFVLKQWNKHSKPDPTR